MRLVFSLSVVNSIIISLSAMKSCVCTKRKWWLISFSMLFCFTVSYVCGSFFLCPIVGLLYHDQSIIIIIIRIYFCRIRIRWCLMLMRFTPFVLTNVTVHTTYFVWIDHHGGSIGNLFCLFIYLFIFFFFSLFILYFPIWYILNPIQYHKNTL